MDFKRLLYGGEPQKQPPPKPLSALRANRLKCWCIIAASLRSKLVVFVFVQQYSTGTYFDTALMCKHVKLTCFTVTGNIPWTKANPAASQQKILISILKELNYIKHFTRFLPTRCIWQKLMFFIFLFNIYNISQIQFITKINKINKNGTNG